MKANHPVSRYQEVEVRTATPTELVVLMYDSAIAGLQQAREAIRSGNISRRVHSLNKVSSIVTELQATLNFEAGGEIAQSLDRLYAYIRNQIFLANLHQDSAPLEEVGRLMTSLRSAWVEVVQAETKQAQSARVSIPSTSCTPAPVAPNSPLGPLPGLSITA